MKLVNETQSIEFVHENWWLCTCGDYPEYSVLAGQYCRALQIAYDSLEEAKAANPGVEVVEDGCPVVASVPDVAPADFDPSYAGERWDEED